VVNEAHVASHAVEDGAILWQFPWPGRSDANASTSQPVPLDDQRLFISKGYHHGCSVWQIKQDAQGKWSTQELWHNRNLKTKFTNVVVQGAFVYGLDEGILTCVRLKDGKRMWKKGRYRNGQVMMIDGKLLVVSESGEVILLEIDEKGSHEQGRFQAVEGKTWANPAFSSTFLLIRNSQQAACYRLPLLPEAEPAVVTVP